MLGIKPIAQRLGIDIRRAKPKLPVISREGIEVSASLISDVFRFHERIPYFYEDVAEPLRIAGAWRGDLEQRRTNQLALLKARDIEGYRKLATRMHFNELVSGLWNYAYSGPAGDAFYESVLDFQKVTNLPLDALHARTPLPTWGAGLEGKLLTYVSVAHAYQAWLVANTQPRTVLDLGSGFGGMAEKLSEMHACQIWLMDIPANLTTAYLYLASRFDGVTLISERSQLENAQGRFILCPTIFADACPRFDVLTNSGSFSEMDLPTIRYYLETLRYDRLIETNSNVPAMNSGGHREVVSRDFPVPVTHRLVARFLPVDKASGGRYVTSIYQLA